ncbi:MAG: glycine/betaine ABC transporter substrate-binding protein, partial [Alphaproteobacteria bacterium]|nr:glycine/betaine ABC transporter substrate-binding protein [Alphaproteobacteria bacterium]
MNKKALAGAALMLASGFGAVQAAELGAVDEPIKLAINEWTGQHVSTHVAGEMLKKAGYQVEYATAGYMNMFQAMADGELHAALEIWTSNVSDQFAALEEAGGVVDVSDLGLDAREGFA